MSRAAVNQVLSGSHTQCEAWFRVSIYEVYPLKALLRKPQWLRLRCEEPSRQGEDSRCLEGSQQR